LHHDYEAVSIDWAATLYYGITCQWDYSNHTYDMSMPGYLKAMLEKFQYAAPRHLPSTPPIVTTLSNTASKCNSPMDPT
jgi:hypothetical protein